MQSEQAALVQSEQADPHVLCAYSELICVNTSQVKGQVRSFADAVVAQLQYRMGELDLLRACRRVFPQAFGDWYSDTSQGIMSTFCSNFGTSK